MCVNTTYLGLDLKSPVVVGSCGLTDSVDNLLKMEQNGAGAVVLKSIFEEQIIYDIKSSANVYAPVDQYGASYDYVASHVAPNFMDQFFGFVRKAKSALSIPVIGSINCYSFENWLTYARRFEEAGCDALELNISLLPYESKLSVDDVERLFEDVINTLKRFVSIPIAIKVSSYFTDMAKFMQKLSWMGINGVTIFSRPLDIDIDIERLTLVPPPLLSEPGEVYQTLRWVAILSKKMKCELSASTGIHTSDDVVKMLLAGAQTVQVVSCLYKYGIEHLRTLNDGLSQWMSTHGFSCLDQIRGRLAVNTNEDASMFLRTQYMKHVNKI